MKKLLTLSFLGIAIFVFYSYLTKGIKYQYKEPNVRQMVLAKTKNHYLDKKISQLIEQNKYDEAKAYINLSKEFNITLLPQTKELIKKEYSTSKKIIRGTKSFFNGFISGKANSTTEVAGAITSDFTIYGDLRDITLEGKKYINNEPYDKLILGLSMAGVALSATTLFTLGTSEALKVGTSSLKIAKRQKYLTKGFSKTLGDTLEKTIDFKALKRVKLGSLDELKQSSKIIKNSVKLKHPKPILKDLNSIKKSTSITDTIHLMKYVDNTKDLKNIAKLSKRYKGATRGILKLFGKNVFRLIKVGIKWTTPLIISAVGLALASITFIITLFSKWD